MIYVVAGLQFGDEGKGACVDALVRRHQAPIVVRYNGGAQAAHHVTIRNGNSHCFSQFGSGTLAGASTYITKYVTIDPPALMREAEALRYNHGIRYPLQSWQVHPDAPVVTPWHRAVNQLKELGRDNCRHGSCGRGIGEVRREILNGIEPITARDLINVGSLTKKARAVRQRLGDYAVNLDVPLHTEPWQAFGLEPAHWAEMSVLPAACVTERMPIYPTMVFEGAQGFLLDETFGFHPHTTWADTTYRQAFDIINDHQLATLGVLKIGVMRAYTTRHGAGPFPTEIKHPTLLAVNDHNNTGRWQGELRVGYLDMPLLRYACRVLHPDVLAVTHLDEMERKHVTVCDRYCVENREVYTLPDPRPSSYVDGVPSELTSFVNACQPIYTPVPDVIDTIEEVGISVALRASGRTARDWWGTED